jgi:hypothetical protein
MSCQEKIQLILSLCGLFSSGMICSTEAQTLKVGQEYQGGIIFFVDSTGQHGLIAAPYDIGTFPLIYRTEYQIIGAEGTEIGTGRQNTVNILKFSTFRGETAPYYCTRFTRNGYSDWFLPSIDELHLLFGAETNIGGFQGGYYWSSSVAARFYVWAETRFGGSTRMMNPYARLNVRPIRAF